METCPIDAVERLMDICHLILECSEVSSDSVAEITDIVFPSEFKFNTLVFNVTRIDRRSSVSDDSRRSDARDDQVFLENQSAVNESLSLKNLASIPRSSCSEVSHLSSLLPVEEGIEPT